MTVFDQTGGYVDPFNTKDCGCINIEQQLGANSKYYYF